VHKEHVTATAVGRYRIRKDDPWPHGVAPWPTPSDDGQKRPAASKAPRTLLNSEVRPYSWPCVPVYVDQMGA
jgi:hypothetical protein